jgi:hypothetical protein
MGRNDSEIRATDARRSQHPSFRQHGASVRRERLPNRRASETFEVHSAGLDYRVTVSRYPDGRLAEIFLSSHKMGSHADNAARDSAIMASIALQYGAALDTVRHAITSDANGQASNPLGVALDLLRNEKRERE